MIKNDFVIFSENFEFEIGINMIMSIVKLKDLLVLIIKIVNNKFG